jgi:hypothetical protein
MWTSPVQPEALLESGYALLLLVMAVGLGHWAGYTTIHRSHQVDLTRDLRRQGERPSAPWPHTEIAHFHHGVALLLVLVAGTLAVIGLIRHHEGLELLLLGVALVLTVLVGQWLLPTFLANHRSLE